MADTGTMLLEQGLAAFEIAPVMPVGPHRAAIAPFGTPALTFGLSDITLGPVAAPLGAAGAVELALNLYVAQRLPACRGHAPEICVALCRALPNSPHGPPVMTTDLVNAGSDHGFTARQIGAAIPVGVGTGLRRARGEPEQGKNDG